MDPTRVDIRVARVPSLRGASTHVVDAHHAVVGVGVLRIIDRMSGLGSVSSANVRRGGDVDAPSLGTVGGDMHVTLG